MALIKKEGIRDEMLRTAARLWGVPEDDIENNFDPLILLLIEACAAELEKINEDISASQLRLIDYLAGMLLPEAVFGASPASGVISVLPLELKAAANEDSSFYLTQMVQRKSNGKSESVELHFTPVAQFTLIKCQLAYLQAGNKFFRIRENNTRELAATSDQSPVSNQLWLLIKPEAGLSSLEGLPVYFDLRNNAAAHNFYNSLQYAKAFLNEVPVSLQPGFGSASLSGLGAEEVLLSGNDQGSKINRKAGFIYERQFITLGSDANIQPAAIPAALAQQLGRETVKQLEAEQLVFLRLEFPQYFPQQALDSVSCSINAFPVVNKKRKSFHYRTDDWLNVVPLPADGIFLDLASIKTEEELYYKIRSAGSVQSLVAGEAIVRSGGVGKTSSNEVRELINNVTEKVRDQSAYFGQLSNEHILGKLREIGKTLAGLEDNMAAATDRKTDYSYLMLRPKNNGETLTVDFWVTNGEDANQVKSGMALSLSHQSPLQSKKCFTVTAFSGGRNRVSESEKTNLLQQQLLSRGKIVSANDVELLCFQLFGDRLKKVEIQKTVQVSADPGQGFQRTIDVLLTYSEQVNDLSKTEADNLCRELTFLLAENSSPIYPYRVMVAEGLKKTLR